MSESRVPEGSATITLITGMHRSGTSAVARLTGLLGVDLGRPELLMPPKPDNPEGFWESLPLVELADDLLAHLGGSWRQPPLLRPGWVEDPELDSWRHRAARTLTEVFGDSRVVGWKDPRSSLIIEFWRAVIPDLNVIVCVRNPIEVAESLYVRDRMDRNVARQLWLQYNSRALGSAPNLVVRFSEVLADPQRVAATISDVVGLTPSPAQLSAIQGSVRSDLRHHVAPDGSHVEDLEVFLYSVAGSAPPGLFEMLKERDVLANMCDVLEREIALERERCERSTDEFNLSAAEARRREAELESRLTDLRAAIGDLERRDSELTALLEEERAQTQLAEARSARLRSEIERNENVNIALKCRLETCQAELVALKASSHPRSRVMKWVRT